MLFPKSLAVALGAACALQAAETVESIKLRVSPEPARVRPFEMAVIQTLFYGTITQKDKEPKQGRLRKDGAKLRVVESGGGWLSKPFAFQGRDSGGFADGDSSMLGRILDNVMAFAKDSVLYTAPEAMGRYTIEEREVASARPPSPSGVGTAPLVTQPAAVPREGFVEIEARVDGSAVIVIQRDSARAEVISGQSVPAPLAAFSSPLPEAVGAQMNVEKRRGRGSVALIEKPSESNGYAAKIRIDDPRGGADAYQVRVNWKLP